MAAGLLGTVGAPGTSPAAGGTRKGETMIDKFLDWLVAGSILRPIGFILVCGVCFLGLLLLMANHSSFPGERAQIESLRVDLARLGNQAIGEDVMGQATEWNQKIRSAQQYNKLWWSGWMVPDGWDEIEPLKIPAAKMGERP